MVVPEYVLHAFVNILFAAAGEWFSLLLNIPLIIYHINRYRTRPVMSGLGIYDPTSIMNADVLTRCQREGWIKLAFYLLSFFYYLYGYVIALESAHEHNTWYNYNNKTKKNVETNCLNNLMAVWFFWRWSVLCDKCFFLLKTIITEPKSLIRCVCCRMIYCLISAWVDVWRKIPRTMSCWISVLVIMFDIIKGTDFCWKNNSQFCYFIFMSNKTYYNFLSQSFIIKIDKCIIKKLGMFEI